MSALMTIEDLLAERAIYRALVSFARAMDERDWDSLQRLTTQDVTADLGTGSLAGASEITALIRSFLDDCGPTQHLLGNVLIDVDQDRASSRCYVSDMHLGQGQQEGQTFSTLGDYHDQWQQVDGIWLLSHRTKLNRAHIGSLAVLGPGPGGWQ